MCKYSMNFLQRTPPYYFFSLDTKQEPHIGIEMAFTLFAASHTAAHMCNFHRFSYTDKDDMYALIGAKVHHLDSPTSWWRYILWTMAVITGIIMVIYLLVAYHFASNQQKQFNQFWYTHHLFLVMLFIGLEICLSHWNVYTGWYGFWLCVQHQGFIISGHSKNGSKKRRRPSDMTEKSNVLQLTWQS